MRTQGGRRGLSAAFAVLALLAGCDTPAGERTQRSQDGARVAVPDAPHDPPRAAIALADGRRTLARASQPGGAHAEVVALRRPSLRGSTTGFDADEGVARVRVSVSERIACSGGELRRRIRYFPPPQIERIRSRPGARLPVRRVRSLVIRVGGGRCGRGDRPTEVRGELWGEAINGSGLEAVTPHIRFRWR